MRLPANATLNAELREDLLGGAVAITAAAERLVAADSELYAVTPPMSEPATLTAIPYYLWANREPGSMQAWIAEGG